MKEKKPNVLLLIPNLGSGGAQRVFHQHRQLLSRDFNVVSCVFNFDGSFPEEKAENILSLNIPAGQNLFTKILYFFRRVRRLKKIKRDQRIDVTVSHLEGADYVSILSHVNDQLILWIHGSKLHDQQIRGITGWFRKRVLLPRLYRRANKIVCVSHGIAAEMTLMVPGADQNISTVRNGIDMQMIKARAAEPLQPTWQSLMSKHFVIVTHCRFAPQKNLRSLLQIIAGLKDISSLRFVLIGDGEQRDELIDLAIKLNVSVHRSWSDDQWSEDSRLFFTGQQTNPFPWLRHASLYVLTSLWEGFPLSICEALACGLPIVAADCHTGPREMLSPETRAQVTSPVKGSAGILMPIVREDSRQSVDLWVQALRDIITDQSTLGNYRKLADDTASLFSSERSKQETIAVVKSVLK